MENTEESPPIGKKIGFGFLGGCGAFVLAFVVVTVCSALAFPFIITADGGSYAESQFFLNIIVPPICGAAAALIASIAAFVFAYVKTR